MANDKRNRDRIVDRKWEKIFEKYDALDVIEREGLFTITSGQINEFKEARLMTKFDYIAQLPDIFYYNDLSILPTKRGEYVVGRFNAYEKMQTRDSTLLKDRKEIVFPDWIETIKPEKMTSESTMLNAAAASNMIHDVFSEDIGDVVQTVSGRMSSKEFKFNIQGIGKSSNNTYELDVMNSQIEIDAGYETPDKLLLFEAKNNTTDSFLIRQLYYPYQLWAKRLEGIKEVYPVFLQYANDTYNFSIFKFDDINDYNSIRLIERRNYTFGAEHTSLNDIVNIFKSTKIVKEPVGIPIPQSNSFNKVLGILESITESEDGFVTNEELSLENDYHMRQADYYTRACMYLNFINRSDGGYVLSNIGKDYINANRRNKNLIVAKQLLEHKPINLVFERGLNRGKPLNGTETFRLLEEAEDRDNTTNLNLTTRERRASTVSSWVRYLFSVVDDF